MMLENWICDTCLVKNDGLLKNGKERRKCEACEVSKYPGEIVSDEEVENVKPKVLFGLNVPAQEINIFSNNVPKQETNIFADNVPKQENKIMFGFTPNNPEVNKKRIRFGMFDEAVGTPQNTVSKQELFHKLPDAKKKKKTNPLEAKISWDESEVLYWGSGECDQLPLPSDDDGVTLEDNIMKWERPFVKISCGSLHTAAITDLGELITFGCNDSGALGRITGCDEEAMPGKVKIPNFVVDVQCGMSHTICRTEIGTVYVCGSYRSPNGEQFCYKNSKEPQLITHFKDPVLDIRAGYDFDVAVLYNVKKKEKYVMLWGINSVGQFGIKASEDFKEPFRLNLSIDLNFVDIFGGSGNIFIKYLNQKNQHVYYSAGKNGTGETGTNSDLETVEAFTQVSTIFNKDFVKFSFGDFHILGLTIDDEIWAWGLSDAALPHKLDERMAIKVPRKINDFIGVISGYKDIICGGQTSIVVKTNGQVLGWGDSSTGQLKVEAEQIISHPKVIFNCGIDTLSLASQHVIALKSTTTKKNKSRFSIKLQNTQGKNKFKKSNKSVDYCPRRSERLALLYKNKLKL